MADEEKKPAAEKTPAERIAEKVKGLKPHALPEVLVNDVLALLAKVPPEKWTEEFSAVAKGARFTISSLPKHLAAERTFHPQAGDLAALLEASGGDAR